MDKHWKVYLMNASGLTFYGEAETRREAVALRQKAGLENKTTGAKVIAYNECGAIKISIHLK